MPRHGLIFWPFPLRVFVVYVGVLWPRSSVRHLIGPFFAPTAATARVRTAVSVILNEPPFWVEPCGSIAVTRMAAVGAIQALGCDRPNAYFCPLNGPCRWMGDRSTWVARCNSRFFPAVISMVDSSLSRIRSTDHGKPAGRCHRSRIPAAPTRACRSGIKLTDCPTATPDRKPI